MTEFDDNLEGIEVEPVPEFYVLTTGSTVERYTSYSRSLTFLGNYYAAASITRGNLKQDNNFGITTLTVTSPITPSIAKYVPNQPIEPVNIVVYRSHIDNLDQYEIFFKGEIKYVQLRGRLASAQCEAKNKYMLTKIPNVIYQSGCNHDIYDDGCQVDPFLWRRSATITGISGSSLTFSFTDGLSAVAVEYFTGGRINFQNDVRLITGNSVLNTLDLHIPFDSRLSVGSSVYLYPGCDGNPATCNGKYNNLIHFLGMPYIPSTNPVIWGFK